MKLWYYSYNADRDTYRIATYEHDDFVAEEDYEATAYAVVKAHNMKVVGSVEKFLDDLCLSKK